MKLPTDLDSDYICMQIVFQTGLFDVPLRTLTHLTVSRCFPDICDQAWSSYKTQNASM